MCEIEDIKARQILDSRGIPTVEADVILCDGSVGRASVPSGMSTGIFEVKELRDKIKEKYFGKGVEKAVSNINTIITPNLIGEDASNQQAIDSLLIELDGTFDKSNLGSNAILAVSLACAKAACEYYNLPLWRYLGGINSKILPAPMINILNGGAHAENNLDFQEFMILPMGFASFSESIRAGAEIFHALKSILIEKGYTTAVGDEGGFAPEISYTRDAIELIVQAVEKAGYNTKLIKICLDVAASELYEEGDCSEGICTLSKYYLRGENKKLTSESMIGYLQELVRDYPIVSIEDGLSQDDIFGWQKLTEQLKEKCLLVGDDIFVTNSKRLQEGIDKNLGNGIIIKPNQIGTLTETIDTIITAQKNNYKTIISHRSGETEDSFIADLAVATNSGFVKFGSVSRSERNAKYNQLLRIEEAIGDGANYLGANLLHIN